MQYRPIFLAPVDIDDCILFNIIVITKIETNDPLQYSISSRLPLSRGPISSN